MPEPLTVTVIDSKARTVPTASRISTTRPVRTVSTSTTVGAACGAAAEVAPCAGEARRVPADERKPRQRPVLIGKPTRVAGSSEHGDEGELSVPAHARFPHDPIVMAWLLLAILAREKQMMCNTFFIFWDRG